MNTVDTIWLQFALCAAAVVLAGYHLSRYGDAIAKHTGLSGSWIGLALLATVTSLPELATGISRRCRGWCGRLAAFCGH